MLFNKSFTTSLYKRFAVVSKTYKCRCSAGLVLGPLLFLIYINDIANSLQGSARLFDDDTSISYSSSDIQYLQLIINEDLQKMHIWACKWLIIFNHITTEVMLVSNTFIDFNLLLILENTILQIVDALRHLGVILTSNNKWNKQHIDSIIESASKRLFYLRKVKYRFSKDILSKLYCTYIRPLLEYASEVWDGCTQADANRLEQIQLTAARNCY